MVQLLSRFLRDSSGAHARGARIASVPEAQLEDFGSGLKPVTQGWFVVNVGPFLVVVE
jgi:hypothetical protein